MSEIGEVFAATKEYRLNESKRRKRNNMNNSRTMLGKNNINYVSKNGGVHIICSYHGKVADFWPSTGKFKIRGDDRYFRGVRLLIKILRGDYNEDQFKALIGE